MLYKYLSDERIDVIENLEIRFTQPGALNDPFDSLPLIEENKEKTKLIEYIKNESNNLWTNIAEEEKTPANYQLLIDTERKLIKNACRKFSPHSLGSSLAAYLNKRIGILSLTKNSSNLLMWSHYANSHKGYVLGFNACHEFFFKEAYDGSDTTPNNVLYTSQRNVIKNENQDFYEKIFCEKPVDWAYEEEVRIFRSFTNNTKISGYDSSRFPIYLIDLPKDSINCIYIGAQADNKFKNKIKQIVTKNDLHVKLYSCKISKKQYKVDFIPMYTDKKNK